MRKWLWKCSKCDADAITDVGKAPPDPCKGTVGAMYMIAIECQNEEWLLKGERRESNPGIV